INAQGRASRPPGRPDPDATVLRSAAGTQADRLGEDYKPDTPQSCLRVFLRDSALRVNSHVLRRQAGYDSAVRRWIALLIVILAFGAPRDPRRQIIGPGGGGSMFHPAVSPHDPRTVLVACDMTGNYVTYNGGET